MCCDKTILKSKGDTNQRVTSKKGRKEPLGYRGARTVQRAEKPPVVKKSGKQSTLHKEGKKRPPVNKGTGLQRVVLREQRRTPGEGGMGSKRQNTEHGRYAGGERRSEKPPKRAQ